MLIDVHCYLPLAAAAEATRACVISSPAPYMLLLSSPLFFPRAPRRLSHAARQGLADRALLSAARHMPSAFSPQIAKSVSSRQQEPAASQIACCRAAARGKRGCASGICVPLLAQREVAGLRGAAFTGGASDYGDGGHCANHPPRHSHTATAAAAGWWDGTAALSAAARAATCASYPLAPAVPDSGRSERSFNVPKGRCRLGACCDARRSRPRLAPALQNLRVMPLARVRPRGSNLNGLCTRMGIITCGGR
jgi:hypothetical protein